MKWPKNDFGFSKNTAYLWDSGSLLAHSFGHKWSLSAFLWFLFFWYHPSVPLEPSRILKNPTKMTKITIKVGQKKTFHFLYYAMLYWQMPISDLPRLTSFNFGWGVLRLVAWTIWCKACLPTPNHLTYVLSFSKNECRLWHQYNHFTRTVKCQWANISLFKICTVLIFDEIWSMESTFKKEPKFQKYI